MTPRFCIQVFSVAGVPVYLHASVVLLGIFGAKEEFSLGWWLGILLVVLVHEVGHLVLMRRYEMQVLEIMVHGFGGYCRGAGWVEPIQKAIIAWGGVLAQAALFAVFIIADRLSLLPQSPHTVGFYEALFTANPAIAVLNLLPIAPLDGADAWKIVPLWFAQWRASRSRRRENAARELPQNQSADRARRLGFRVKRDKE